MSLPAKKTIVVSCAALLSLLVSANAALSAPPPYSTIMIGMGDSIGEGVQSADASQSTQPFSYLNLLSLQLQSYFTLPMIRTDFMASVGNTTERFRIDPASYPFNLAVSGADVRSLLREAADAQQQSEIASETDLVLFPWVGSQIEIAEFLARIAEVSMVVCWIGNNDALSAAISYDRLDASQLTPVEEFRADFTEVVERIHRLGKPAIFANIPDVTKIGFLLDRDDLARLLGSDHGLPEGSYTSIVAMLLVKLGLDDGSVFRDPQFVLDPTEISLIGQRVQAFNDIIEGVAGLHGYPVVDIKALFDDMDASPPVLFGVELSNRFLGGLFSLDGVHPSNIGHALIANAFIETMNARYELGVPPIGPETLELFVLTDPFVDKDGDGTVTGRFGAGLLETLGPFLGLSGDLDDFAPARVAAAADPALGEMMVESLLPLEAGALRASGTTSRARLIETFRDLFGLRELTEPWARRRR